MTDYKAMAEAQVRLSPCTRRKVGAVLVLSLIHH